MSMHAVRGWGMAGAVLATVLVLLGPGCGPPPSRRHQGLQHPDRGFPGQSPFGSDHSSRRRRDRDAIVVVHMQFDVLRVELPADEVHHSDKAWNHVDELTSDPARTALLRRNGFRMGTAPADAWPALRAVFEACDARVIRASHNVQRGLPLTLDLGPVDEHQSVFLLTPDDRLVGTTFDSGNKYLHLDYELNADARGTTTIQMTPEIHRHSATKRWRNLGGQLRQVSDYQGKVFRQLSKAIDVAGGEFLVIGPDSTATPLSVGHRFLTRTLEGRKYETVLCITPQPFRTGPAKR